MIKARYLMFAIPIFLSAALMAHDPVPLKAADCSGIGEQLCDSTEACVNYLFSKICTTRYEYSLGMSGRTKQSNQAAMK